VRRFAAALVLVGASCASDPGTPPPRRGTAPFPAEARERVRACDEQLAPLRAPDPRLSDDERQRRLRDLAFADAARRRLGATPPSDAEAFEQALRDFEAAAFFASAGAAR
jgi:hypothetical protein